MKKTAVLAATAALLTMVGAAPALAEVDQTRTLAAHNVLYAIDCEDEIGQVAKIDPLTAIATEVFAGYDNTVRTDISCAGGAAWVPGTNDVYWISWDDTDILEKMDIRTGESTMVGSTGVDTKSIAAGPDGTLYVLYNDSGTPTLGSINTTDGSVTRIATVTGVTGSYQANSQYTFSYSPSDQKYYASNNGDRHLYEINVDDATVVDLGTNFDNYNFWGFAIDSAGTVFTTGDGNIETLTLDTWGTADIQSTTHTDSNNIVLGANDNWYSQAAFIVDETKLPGYNAGGGSLAATGTNAAANLLVTAGAAVLLLAGAATLISTRRRKSND